MVLMETAMALKWAAVMLQTFATIKYLLIVFLSTTAKEDLIKTITKAQ